MASQIHSWKAVDEHTARTTTETANTITPKIIEFLVDMVQSFLLMPCCLKISRTTPGRFLATIM